MHKFKIEVPGSIWIISPEEISEDLPNLKKVFKIHFLLLIQVLPIIHLPGYNRDMLVYNRKFGELLQEAEARWALDEEWMKENPDGKKKKKKKKKPKAEEDDDEDEWSDEDNFFMDGDDDW